MFCTAVFIILKNVCEFKLTYFESCIYFEEKCEDIKKKNAITSIGEYIK